MVELVDTLCSGRSDRMVVRVQLSLPAPHSIAVEPVSTGREREPKGSLFFFPLPPPHTHAHFFDCFFIPFAAARPDRRLGVGSGVDLFFLGGAANVPRQ